VNDERCHHPGGTADGLPAVAVRVRVGAGYRHRIAFQDRNPGGQGQSPMVLPVQRILVRVPGPFGRPASEALAGVNIGRIGMRR
jgi:hypothetical protein